MRGKSARPGPARDAFFSQLLILHCAGMVDLQADRQWQCDQSFFQTHSLFFFKRFPLTFLPSNIIFTQLGKQTSYPSDSEDEEDGGLRGGGTAESERNKNTKGGGSGGSGGGGDSVANGTPNRRKQQLEMEMTPVGKRE